MFDRMLPQLRRDEGWTLLPYRDSLGILTIGCGHNLSVPISNAAVLQILKDDFTAVREQLERFHWFLNLDTVRQGALINMGFMGVGKLLGFRNMIEALGRQDWEAAATEMLDSLWARQVGQRAQRLALQMRSGEWQ
ncbi:MAG TPA: lysozyme [Methylomirabilota bacterium]|nr:lysozyme [Methylomirabilota bacterium]